jgi:glutaminyl-tRNA synthetase
MVEIGFAEIKRRAPWPNLEGERDIAPWEAGPETVRFQGLRVAYFFLDRDTTDDNIVINRIVSLKEDGKKA